MSTKKIRTVRVFDESLALVQKITRDTGEKQPGLLKRLLEAEDKRLERQRTRADWNRL